MPHKFDQSDEGPQATALSGRRREPPHTGVLLDMTDVPGPPIPRLSLPVFGKMAAVVGLMFIVSEILFLAMRSLFR